MNEASTDLPEDKPYSPLRRMAANTGWLVGGKAYGAVISLVYLAIITRSLGVAGFGQFALIVGIAQAIITVAEFQTWRVVVRYGADHIHGRRDWGAFGRLAMLCGGLDIVGALVGCAIAYGAIYAFGGALGWDAGIADVAFAFTCASLFALVSTPTGVVRALDRFDLAILVEAVVPTGRLMAAVAIWLTGPSVARFLIAWALIDLIEAGLYWYLARRLAPEAIRLGHLRGIRRAVRENRRIGEFFLVTYATSTLEAAVKQGPLLVVGFFVGEVAAGLYRLAAQLANALTKLSSLLTRTVYTELSRARVAIAAGEFARLVGRTSIAAAGAGIAVIGVTLIAGRAIMAAIGGSEFGAGYVILMPLVVAASIDLASVSFEPVLHSGGRVKTALTVRAAAVAVLVIAMWLLLPRYEALGAAWSVIAASVIAYLLMGALAWRSMRTSAQG